MRQINLGMDTKKYIVSMGCIEGASDPGLVWVLVKVLVLPFLFPPSFEVTELG